MSGHHLPGTSAPPPPTPLSEHRLGLDFNRLLSAAAVTVLIGLGLAAEFTSIARPDIGFLLDAAGRMLDGGRLYEDIVEINPPLIVALNLPAVLLARGLGLSPILVYRIGFTLALLTATLLSARGIYRVVPGTEPWCRRLLLLLSAFVLFPLSGQDFGQREHLLLAFILPYLFLATARVQGREVPKGEALSLGILVGLGFALKPHFLLLWLAIEVYVRRASPGRRWNLLPETAGIAAFLALYGLGILVLTPQYLPLLGALAGPYGRFLYDPFLHLLVTGPGAALAWLALLAFLALRRGARQPELWAVLATSVAACFCAGAAQQKGLRYHFYPSFGLAVVLLGLIATNVRRPLQSFVQRIYRVVALSVTVTAILVVSVENLAGAVSRDRQPGRRRFEELARLVRAHAAGQGIYVMSYHIGSAYPLVNYSGAWNASRFPQLWILAADYLASLKSDQPLRYHDPGTMDESERYLNRAVLTDLEHHRPKLLLVLRHARDLPANGYRRLNYIAYFGRDPRFARIFGRYQRLADVGDYTVYQRLEPGQLRTAPPPSSDPGTQDVMGADTEGLHLRLEDPEFLLHGLVFALVALWAVAVEAASQPPVFRRG